jgi:hypothetical protein
LKSKSLIKNLIIISVFILTAYTSANAQTILLSDTLNVNIENSYKVSSLNIVPFSEQILIGKKLLSKSDYIISYKTGKFEILDHVQYSLLDSIIISYKSLVVNLSKENKRRSLIISYDDKFADTVRILKNINQSLTTESIFGKELQKSGALVRGFTVGTNRDFTLNSGLRLQLSGKLSDDIEIVAALTDENTPIQPEGNTETLEELDKVFIEIRHRNAIGTFGDYELNERQTEFAQITRILQGLKGEFIYGNNRGVVSIAGSRGKFNTNQFYGNDGNQGPYRLYGINNERAIIVIAGSEKIYIDGELLTRGENNDYIIDYSNSEITFTPRRLITSASRISVDFEYTDQNYKTNFFGANFSSSLFDERLKVNIGYYKEGDDENNPVEYSFNEEDKNILKKAGDSRNAALKTGVSFALPDSLGRITGVYSKIDTLINATPFTIYKYLPGSESSIYNVSFTYVGEGNGDYEMLSLGNYNFTGIKNGAYLPVIFLPLPESKQLGNISIKSVPIKGINLNVELSGSSWDKNLLSDLNDEDNLGYARNIKLEIEPREIIIGNSNLGKLGLNFRDRFIEARYKSLDRIDDVEFNRYYNVSNVSASDQILREASLNYAPITNLSLLSKYGFLKQSESFKSDRFYNEIKYNDTQNNVFDYTIDYVKNTNGSVNSTWNKQNGRTAYSFGLIRPGFDFIYENKEDYLKDSLLLTSFNFIEAVPNIVLSPFQHLIFSAGYSYREESYPIKHELELQSQAYTQKYSIDYRGLKEFTTSMNLTFRKKKYTEQFRMLGYGDNETVLFLSQSRVNLWNNFIQGDIYYQAATEQSAQLEKVFVKVPKGSGSYIYLGDLNNNGIAEESEFQLTSYEGDYILVTIPTDKLFPVIDLKTNTRWKINFDKAINGTGIFAKFIKSFQQKHFGELKKNKKQKRRARYICLIFQSS